MAQPHDHLFQVLFSDPEHAVPLLRSALPAPLVEAIDWTTLPRQPATQRGARGRKTICDVLFSAQTRQRAPLLLYLVLEHKSQSNRFDALQLLEQVVAVVRTPAAGRDLVTFAAWVDEWRDVHEQAARIAEATTAREAYDAVVHYVLETSGLPRLQVDRVLRQRLSSSTMKNFRSTLDQTRDEGKTEGRAELVLRQLRRRFGDAVTQAVESHVRRASTDELDRFGERLLDAATIDAVFAN